METVERILVPICQQRNISFHDYVLTTSEGKHLTPKIFIGELEDTELYFTQKSTRSVSDSPPSLFFGASLPVLLFSFVYLISLLTLLGDGTNHVDRNGDDEPSESLASTTTSPLSSENHRRRKERTPSTLSSSQADDSPAV